MNDIKTNRELYQQYTATDPKLLARISRLLIVCQSEGISVPKGIRNIFEFTWEELTTDPMIPTPSEILGLEISIGAPPMVLMEPAPVQAPVQNKPPLPVLPLPMLPASTGPAKFSTHSPTHGQRGPSSQETLHRFQRQSIHLLTELLTLKMKAMLESMSNSSTNIPAMGVNSPYQLVYESSTGCLSFSLSTGREVKKKTATGKPPNLEEVVLTSPQRGAGTSASEVIEFSDPCPEAREKLQEMCRLISQKGLVEREEYLLPMILRNYRAKMPPHLMSTPKGDAQIPSSHHPHPPGAQTSTPTPHQPPAHHLHLDRHFQEWKAPKKAIKLHYTFYDGSFFNSESFLLVLLNNFCQLSLWTHRRVSDPHVLQRESHHLPLYDTPSFSFLAVFNAEGQGCVHYNLKACCPYVLVLDEEGGTTNDYKGYVVHKWSWTSKTETLLSLEYKVNEQMKLMVLGQDSIMATFTSLNETVTLPISANSCPHGTSHNKRSLPVPLLSPPSSDSPPCQHCFIYKPAFSTKVGIPCDSYRYCCPEAQGLLQMKHLLRGVNIVERDGEDEGTKSLIPEEFIVWKITVDIHHETGVAMGSLHATKLSLYSGEILLLRSQSARPESSIGESSKEEPVLAPVITTRKKPIKVQPKATVTP
ncbi:hypothetical protein EI555_001587, partial [Monodon monoceros]